MTTPHLAQVTGSEEWYTPSEVVEAAREVLGVIDLDPASCAAAQVVVQADRYYTVQDDGLAQPWSGRVWLNPPYARGKVKAFTRRLTAEYVEGRVTEAVCLTNNATDTIWFHELVEPASALFFPRGRIEFLKVTPVGVVAPSAGLQGSVLTYLGGRPQWFIEVFTRRVGGLGVPLNSLACASRERMP